MRKLVVIILMSMLFACDDENGEDVLLAQPGRMKMELDEVEMVSSTTKLPEVVYDPVMGVVTIRARFQTQSNPIGYSLMSISIYGVKVGEFDLVGGGFASDITHAYYSTPASDVYFSFQVNEAIAGKVRLTQFDLNKNLISGTFEIKVADWTATEILVITSGSFTEFAIN